MASFTPRSSVLSTSRTDIKPESGPKPFPNKYAAPCARCKVRVEPGEGLTTKVNGKWVVEHHQPCPTPQAEAPAQPAERDIERTGIFDGDYTVETQEGHRTFRLRTQPLDDEFMPGVQIIKFLSGPDNESDYTQFGHIAKNGSLRVWKRFKDSVTLVADAQALLANPEAALTAARCYRCGHKLTVPASIHNGLGPECYRQGL